MGLQIVSKLYELRPNDAGISSLMSHEADEVKQENTPTPTENDLDDHRALGEWRTVYPCRAWLQISAEFIYLIALLLSGLSLLAFGAWCHVNREVGTAFPLAELSRDFDVSKWVALSLAGLIGGTVFDLKWLYHSVANRKWHCDRVLWRVIVPFNSAAVSLFTGFLLASGVIPFLKAESFSGIYTLLGLGFVFGYFSDNILAALQNLAQEIFGTLKDSK